ncbi:glycoside hydrolase family 2 protein [Reichenbachiella agariperforans]|uniref:glycoside hydrolase family 2 protein n=1 Tax=Reichenbachiella agariperforans TaxID=156994 RepID=UPI001C090FEB|nr:glycoside hydrolase family 2 TIM barrel-domain containing protein [Reichenbachiella agariperforans]MBU2912893.1 DUF4982 domain-containing protein [Reichenbachiella agariperforans]
MRQGLLTTIWIAAVAVCSFQCSAPGEGNTRSVTGFNEGWKFTRDTTETKIWEEVQLPHTVQIEPLVVNDMWQGTSWYEKDVDLSLQDGQRAFVRFEGVMHEADVWFNDRFVTQHQGGYLPFSIDITDYLDEGSSNTLRVRVNNENNPVIPPGKAIEVLDFSYYGGIYRDVTLSVTDDIYITDAVHANQVNSGGVLVHFTEVSSEVAKGILKVHIKNDSHKEREVYINYKLDGKDYTSETVRLAGESDTTLMQTLEVKSPRLWSPQSPELYEIAIEVMADHKPVDQLTETTGIRKIELTDDGFFINGKSTFIRGTNRHQEYPYVGYAISDAAQYRDAVKIKNAGFDMVRLSHYPQDEAFLKACDELGIIVMNCLTGWQFVGNEAFVANSYQEIRDMIRRDRNHPSVFFWEVSLNESGMSDEFMVMANDILDAELPYQDIYSAGWIDHPSYDLFIPARQHGKSPDYWNNYQGGTRKVFIAEYGDWEYYAQNAGFNQKAFEDLAEEARTSRQLRSAGEQRLQQQALNYQEATNSNRKGRDVGTIGDANWLMFDYNRGYADDLEASGISDVFRIPKFAHSFYRSQRPAAEQYGFAGIADGSMVDIATFWTESSSPVVKVYSNADEVALYLNEELVEKKLAERDIYATDLDFPPFVFDLGEFEAGTLRAEAFVNGEVVASDTVTTALEPTKLGLSVDLSGVALTTERSDVVFIYATVVDQNGTLVSDDSREVTFALQSEEAELIGENPVRAEAGIATILLRTTRFTKEIKITATAEGMSEGELILSPEMQ